MNTIFSQQLEKTLMALCRAAGTPRACTVGILVRHREWEQLLQLRLNPAHYLVTLSGAEKLFWDTQVTEFVRKLDVPIRGRNLRQECWEAFLEDERTNACTNARFRRLIEGPLAPSDEPQITLLREMKLWIRRILGRAPENLDSAKFGKGGTYGDVGTFTTVPDKMMSRPTVYSSSRSFLPLWHASAWSRGLVKQYAFKSDPRTVRGNRFGSVSKDALKRRGIASEASLSGFWQLGVGRPMRKRLKRFGIDLDTGQLKHGRWAREASLDCAKATIDLSSASNLNARVPIRELLPSDWRELLDALRAPLTRSPGPEATAKWFYLEMFSSMGNGFTFELETVVFLAACLAASSLSGFSFRAGRDILVYGDDIIVPVEIAPLTVEILKWLGHKPNPRKTFLSGHFKESCGSDFFRGVPVRAHYQTIDPQTPAHWVSLANGLRRVAKAPGCSVDRWTRMLPVWRSTLDNIPTSVRKLRGPETLGDAVIHDDRGWILREVSPTIYEVRGLIPIPMEIGWEHWCADIVFAAALYGCYSSGVTPRRDGEDVILDYRIGWLACLERPAADTCT